MTRKDKGRETWVPDSGLPESGHAAVSSVVNVLKGATALANHPKYKAKMEEIFKVYGDLLSGKLCQNPPVRGAFGEATIPLKQGYRPRLPNEGRARAGNDQDPEGVDCARVD